MSDKSTLLKTFNQHFFDFLDDILRIFPDNTDLAIARKSFETIKRANPTAIIKVWMNFVYTPYKAVIDAGNIEFFFEKDYSNDLSHLANGNEIMKVIDVMRTPIKEMSDSNREHATKYIQNLSKISQIYVSM
jgi:hypothetical protein